MLSRKLFCVNDPTHADFGWAAKSTFFHMRKYDACGNTTAQWTFPVAESAPGELSCAVCGGAVFVAGLSTQTPGDVVSCDFLGRCQSAPADANLARLEDLATRLAAVTEPAERARLAPAVAALLNAVADNPAALEIVSRHKLADTFAA
ncbi:hypothetical protein K9F62_06600 [Desulfovibrio sp. JY]|nr:hypothetical protein K9F62_06600 [Desulfovibrio sp. JY]